MGWHAFRSYYWKPGKLYKSIDMVPNVLSSMLTVASR
jgi:hypothetical protein